MNFENDCGSVSNGGDNGILSGAIGRGSPTVLGLI